MIIANTGIGIVQELRAKRNLDDLAVIGEVVESDSPEVDESLLTGEAEPVLKRPGDQLMSGSFVDQRGDAHFALKLAGAVLPWTAVGVATVSGVLLEVVRRRAARRLSPSS